MIILMMITTMMMMLWMMMMTLPENSWWSIFLVLQSGSRILKLSTPERQFFVKSFFSSSFLVIFDSFKRNHQGKNIPNIWIYLCQTLQSLLWQNLFATFFLSHKCKYWPFSIPTKNLPFLLKNPAHWSCSSLSDGQQFPLVHPISLIQIEGGELMYLTPMCDMVLQIQWANNTENEETVWNVGIVGKVG